MEHIKEWNPRYLAYCRANHNNPDQQILLDRIKYPGGHMTSFMLWNNLHWVLFFKEAHGLDKQPNVITNKDHRMYNNFLLHYYPLF